MKKMYLFVVAALMGASSVQAQTTIASLGFEAGDAKAKSSQYALTPGKSIFGDWVNVKDEDAWDEQYTGEVKSGEFALHAENADPDGNSWDRGFKIAQLPIKESTLYRVSFWVKGPEGGKLSSWLSQGIENFDKSICTASGHNYGLDQVTLNGEWQHMSFVSYYKNADVLNSVIENQSWVGGSVFPEEFGGDGTETYKEHFDGKLPEEFFFVANMFSAGEYLLDDIKIEEGMTFNEATFFSDVIKLDFGFQTNIAELAKANGGYLTLDPSCVSVKIDGTEAPVEFVEGMTDGFVYIFLKEVYADPEQNVTVSFTPADDCPIRITDEGTGEDTKLVAFQNETAYAVESIDAVPSAWSPAVMVSSNPENESFELESATFNNIAVTYNKGLDLTYASATLSKNGVDTDLTNGMTLSEDKKTINIAVSNLADGEYTLTVAGVANSFGVECEGEQVIIFSVGKDTDTSLSEVIYSTNETFAQTANGTFPVGWLANDNGTIHQYGLTDNGDVWNYNWGGNIGGGGCRAMTGYSGDLNGAAIYWRNFNGDRTLGTLTYGEQVKDYLLPDGSLDPEMPEGISLYLDARKYQITIRMCAWKNLGDDSGDAPLYDFTLEDLAGNVYARFQDVPAEPSVHGQQNIAVTNVTRSQTDFTVDQAGYYMLKFSSTQNGTELLLGGVDLITMPSKAAYWKQQLAVAVEKAEPILEAAGDEAYDGETKTAFEAAINHAQNGHFTSPSEITALIAELDALGAKMQARVSNIDAFSTALAEAGVSYAELEGKYLEAEIAVTAKEMLDKYEETNPSALSDEELAEVTPKLVSAAAQLKNVQECTDILTWGAYKAAQAAELLGADASAAYALTTDDREVVDKINSASTLALYNLIAESNGNIDDSYKTTVNYDAGTKIVIDDVYTDMTGEEVAASGIDLTGFIMNPRFYTFTTDGSANLKDNTVVGWGCEQLEGGAVHLANGASATAEKPVITSAINAYAGGAEYMFYQMVGEVPVGVYDVYIASRTAIKNNPDGDGVKGVFNAMNDETGEWDKYIFAQVDDEHGETVAIYTTPFAAGSSWFGHPTVIHGVPVNKGQLLTIGVVEHYVSGKASGHDFDAETGEYVATDRWNTNTFAGEARLYFTDPLAGFDYAAAAGEISVGVQNLNTASRVAEIFSISGVRRDTMQKGVNIVRRADGSAAKVLVK